MAEQNIFTVGGTVQAGSGRYIHRKVDDELLDRCRNLQFAFVLTARQMGKSSLMIRTSERLQEEGTRTVIVDLSQMGVQVTDESWYFGFIMALSRSLRLTTNVFQWWKEHEQLGYTQRMMQFFQEVMLKEIATPIVIFIDEIDSTLSLPFTDDFFAAIRYVYNVRSIEPALKRLSFVLIGVATPSDLINDARRTPFNIGYEVDLNYFTLDEALPLAEGFALPPPEARRLLKWVIQSTGGHPYLTQRLCQLIVDQRRTEWTEADVGELIADAFLGQKSEHDSNLRFVHDMLTRRSEDPQAVLIMYQHIRRGRRVTDDKQSLTISHLKLAGIVCRKNGYLVVTNPIYAAVFDENWLKKQWPEHWIKRVPPAVLGLAAASFLAVILLGLALLQTQRASQAEARSAMQLVLNDSLYFQVQVSDSLRDLSDQANLQLSEQVRISDSLREGVESINARLTDQIEVSESLRRQTEDANQQLSLQFGVTDSLNRQLLVQIDVADSLRGVTEQHLAETRAARLETITIALASKASRQLRLGDAELAALLARQAFLFSEQGNGEFLDPIYDAMRQSLNALDDSGAAGGGPEVVDDAGAIIRSVAYSPDGRWLAAGAGDGIVNLYARSGSGMERVHRLQGHRAGVRALAFSPNGSVLASGGDDAMVYLWRNFDAEKPDREEFEHYQGSVWALAFSPDGQLATGGAGRNVSIRSMAERSDSVTLALPDVGRIRAMAFSADGRFLAAGSESGAVSLWSWHVPETFPATWDAGQGPIHALAFSPVDDLLVSGGDSLYARMWRLDGANAVADAARTLHGHEGPIHAVAFSPDGTMLASGSADRSVQVWDVRKLDVNPILLQGHTAWVWALAFDPSSNRLASAAADRTIQIWPTRPGELARQICDTLRERELSREDWDTFVGDDFPYEQNYQPCSLTTVSNSDIR